MAGVTATVIGMVAVQVVGGLIAQAQASGDRKSADEAMAKARDTLLNAGVPPDVAKPLILKELQKQGTYTPEMEHAVDKLTSSMSDIKENKSVQDMQLNALKGISQRASGGLTPEDRVAMMNLQDQMAQQSQQEQAAIAQNMQQRGIGGGGAEIAAMLGSSQGALQQGAQGARQLMSDQSRRALDALSQQGSLSGQIRGQDFQIASAKASAQDAMNRFNTENQMNQEMRNVNARNDAQRIGLSEAQRIADDNTQMANKEKERQKEDSKWIYNEELRKRGLQGDAYQSEAAYRTGRANQTAGQTTGIANSIGQGIGLAALSKSKDKKDNKDAYTDYLLNDEDKNS